MDVEVLLFGRLRELATRQGTITLSDGARLVDLIELLTKEYGVEFRQELNHVERLCVLMNGQHYDLLGNLERPLKNGDELAILPVTVGG